MMKIRNYGDVANRGTMRRIDYTAKDVEGKPIRKYANVYLPYGYDEGNEKYNVLYVMHGGGGNPDAWLDCCYIKNMFDYAFSAKEADPCIVVFPTYYTGDFMEARKQEIPVKWEDRQILYFQRELREDLIPAVEGTFRTYAEDLSLEGLKASRTHRAFTGFSMGGGCTWYAFTENLNIIADFLPLSGDCWVIEPRGSSTKPVETADYLEKLVKDNPLPFHIFAATGTEDMANRALTPLIDELKKRTGVFRFSEEFSEGNLHYMLLEGWRHRYEEVFNYIYTYLPFLFKY